MPKYLTTEDWIARFRDRHGDRYDYSKVETKGNLDPVIIVCSIHGEFKKTPYAHGTEAKPCDGCVKDAVIVKCGKDFLVRFQAKHGTKFDYYKVVFKGATKPITIVCPVHGEFSVTPINHLRSESGCRKCGHIEKVGVVPVKSRLTPIERFIKRHGDKYDYSLVEYRGQFDRVTVICPDHGRFTVSPVQHWKGSGCKECNTKSITHDECIRRFREQHGNKFDYSKTKYVSPTQAVIVICPTHGDFSVQPVNHWKTQVGCGDCARDIQKQRTAESVISRFIAVHGDAYAYDNFEYDHMHSLSQITCKKHGDFPMSAANHLSDHGCPSCWQNTKSKPESAWGNAIANLSGWNLEQAVKVDGVTSVIDFVVKDSPFGSLAIEYDGHYWHSGPEMMGRDTRKTQQLLDAGYTVVRLRSDEGHLVALPPVPGAINIWVPAYPNDEAVKLASKEIDFALRNNFHNKCHSD